MWTIKMFVKLVSFWLLFNVVVSQVDAEDGYHGQPYPESPCTTFDGSCAKRGSCPQNSRIVTEGLCPVQQKDGIECCVPKKAQIRCRSRGGSCESINDIQCSQDFTVKDATDCAKDEVCCIFLK